MIQSSPFLIGSSDLLVLLVLRRTHLHCWGIVQRLQQLSRDAVQLDENAVHVSLNQMQSSGWVEVVPARRHRGRCRSIA
jgi:PadR family transcriptional regulator PadR